MTEKDTEHWLMSITYKQMWQHISSNLEKTEDTKKLSIYDMVSIMGWMLNCPVPQKDKPYYPALGVFMASDIVRRYKEAEKL